MPALDSRVDAYIAQSDVFAQPVLRHLRAVIHDACPGVAECIKWSMPHFVYDGPLCHMAAFKRHVAFGLRHAPRLPLKALATGKAMGNFGRIASLQDLPPERELADLIRHAMQINEQGAAGTPSARAARPPVVLPAALEAALGQHAQAAATFASLTAGKQREYADWIGDAKTAATRERRLAQAIDWLAEGKSRYWKYAR